MACGKQRLCQIQASFSVNGFVAGRSRCFCKDPELNMMMGKMLVFAALVFLFGFHFYASAVTSKKMFTRRLILCVIVLLMVFVRPLSAAVVFQAAGTAVSSAGAAPTFVAAGAVTSNTTAITPALPSGIAANDILLLFLETGNEAISIANQNGGTWTEVLNSPQGTGTTGTFGTGTRLTVFWSRYNGTQGAPTTSDSGDHQAGIIAAFRGVVASGNPWDVTAGGVEATSDTSGSIPGATTTVPNTLVVAAIAASLPDSTSTTNFGTWTNGNLTSLTERIDNAQSAGNGGAIGIAAGGKTTAGAYGNTAVTLATAAYKGMMSIALKPVTAPITPVWPAHQANDIALLVVETANQAVTLSTPAGFVEVLNSPQGTGTAAGTAATRLSVFWKRAASSAESNPTVADSGDHQIAQIITFRGGITSGNPWDVTAGNVASSASTSVSIPGATTTVANTLVVAIVANATDTATAQTGNWANPNLTSLTERADSSTDQGNGGGFGVATGVKATAGAYVATTATLATSSVQGRMSIALKPEEFMYWSGNFSTIALAPITAQGSEPNGSQATTLYTNGDVDITADVSTAAQLKKVTDPNQTLVTSYMLTDDGDGITTTGGTDQGSYTVHSSFLSPTAYAITHVAGDDAVVITLHAKAANPLGEVADAGSYSATQTLTASWGGP